jgi:hypothetical protein
MSTIDPRPAPGDPLGHLRLVEADYQWSTARLMELAARRCGAALYPCSKAAMDSVRWEDRRRCISGR